jgi:hypothetical protein
VKRSAFPARLVIHGPCLCRPYRLSLVVVDQWVPFIHAQAWLGVELNPFALAIDIPMMSTAPPTTE